MSIENTSKNVEVYNCILAHNALNASTLAATPGDVRELFVGNVEGFKSDHNVLVGLTPGAMTDGQRRLVDHGGNEYDNLVSYVNATTDLDEHSYSSDPAFADSADGDFKINAMSSDAMDAAKTDLTGWVSPFWLAVDARGFTAHDVYGVPNAGSGSASYADIGPYEFDGPPGAPTIAVCWQQFGAEVAWTEHGDDGDTGTAGQYEVIVNGQVMDSGSPAGPGNPEVVSIGLQGCATYSIKVRMTEVDNNQTAESDAVVGSTSCGTPPPCGIEFRGGGEESKAKSARDGAVDFPLDLSRAMPSPSRGMSTVSWSVPRAQAGTAFELAVFDVSGRQVSTLARGVAEPGRFAQEVSFRSQEGSPLGNGVYFMRLRVGDRVLLRTVILAR